MSERVTVTSIDCEQAAEFWTHNGLPVPEAVSTAFKAFKDNPTIETQNRVRMELCREIGFGNYELFKTDLFSAVVEESKKKFHLLSSILNPESKLNI